MDLVILESVVDLEMTAVQVPVGDIFQMSACFRLRHDYFVRERGWVVEGGDRGLEQDGYDKHALHLGVWDGDEVAAYLRVLPFDPRIGFMLDRELSATLSREEREALSRENSVELSRLVCATAMRKGHAKRARSVELLLKRLYQVSLQLGFKTFYIVVEESWLHPFSRRFGLPFRVIGKPYEFPDGTKTVAAVATIEELEAGMRRHSEAKYQWYRDGLDGI